MIRTLFLRNLRQTAGIMATLSLGLFFFEWALVWVAARIDMGPGFRQLLSTILPASVVETIFGQFGFASFEGAVSFGYQHPLSLVAGVALVMVAATIPAHERETGLLDLILSRPLTRTRYLAAAALLVLLAAALPALALLGGSSLGLHLVESSGKVAWTRYLPSAAVLGLLLGAIGSYILLFATGAIRRGVAVAQAVGITLLFYWLDFMGDYWDILETARLLSPFHFFDPAEAAASGFPVPEALALTALLLVCTGASFLNFHRQNL